MGSGPASNIVFVLARVYVDDVEAALPLYRRLAGDQAPHRFAFRGVSLASVGPFLLIQGADTEARTHTATVGVRDINTVVSAVRADGGDIVEGPAPGPNGPRPVARARDGAVFEYIQLDERVTNE